MMISNNYLKNVPLLGLVLFVLNIVFALIIVGIDSMLKLNIANGAAQIGGITAAIILGQIYVLNTKETMPWHFRLKILSIYMLFNIFIAVVFSAVAGFGEYPKDLSFLGIFLALGLFYLLLLYFALGFGGRTIKKS